MKKIFLIAALIPILSFAQAADEKILVERQITLEYDIAEFKYCRLVADLYADLRIAPKEQSEIDSLIQDINNNQTIHSKTKKDAIKAIILSQKDTRISISNSYFNIFDECIQKYDTDKGIYEDAKD